MVTTKTFENETDILVAPEVAVAFPCIVGNTGIDANAEGKKIIKAGTPLFGSVDFLFNRDTVLRTTSDSTYKYVAGVARWDIDVTAGNTNATVLYAGYVDYLKLETAVQTAVTTALTAGGYEPTKGFRITFIKGRVK